MIFGIGSSPPSSPERSNATEAVLAALTLVENRIASLETPPTTAP
jgi:hypothetical protein